MKLHIERQESYSRGELLLRTFFGYFYIIIPHGLALLFVGIWASILNFVAMLSILFTGRYPVSTYEFMVKYLSWSTRVSASIYNLIDGYPAFGLSGSHPAVTLEIPYPENLSRVTLLLKVFFGAIYVLIPHTLVLIFVTIVAVFYSIYAWFAVLFSGQFPQSAHNYLTGTLRWSLRINLYMGYWLTDEYPPFSTK